MKHQPSSSTKKKDMSTDDNALNSSDASEAANLTTSKREY